MTQEILSLVRGLDDATAVKLLRHAGRMLFKDSQIRSNVEAFSTLSDSLAELVNLPKAQKREILSSERSIWLARALLTALASEQRFVEILLRALISLRRDDLVAEASVPRGLATDLVRLLASSREKQNLGVRYGKLGWETGEYVSDPLVDLARVALAPEGTPLPALREEPEPEVAPMTRSGMWTVDAEPEREVMPRVAPVGERRINVWVGDNPDGTTLSLDIGVASLIYFMVGRAVPASVVAARKAIVPDSDVPQGGLDTSWVVWSSDLELASLSPEITVEAGGNDGRPEWTAKFALHIPVQGDSNVAQLMATPRAVPSDLGAAALNAGIAHLYVLIYVRAELYRELTVALVVRSAQLQSEPSDTVRVEADRVRSPIAHQCLTPPHEWTTPPGHLSIAVVSKMAILVGDTMGPDTSGKAAWVRETGGREPWVGTDNRVSGQLKNVLADAERFRAKHESYLNDISPADLFTRLSNPNHQYDWSSFHFRTDPAHEQAWQVVATSPELWAMASDGRMLYDLFFPPKSRLRKVLDFLRQGHRIDIDWTPLEDSYIPHVPWGLLYLGDVPAKGQPVDPSGFFGLRFRIGYTSHVVQGGTSKALGRLENTYSARLMYEGGPPGGVADVIADESRWQRTLWSKLANQIMAPSGQGDPLAELRLLLEDPTPAPISVLYIYCQSGGQVSDPFLRFGPPTNPYDLTRADLGVNEIPGQPLVFANACSTATADPYVASLLEEAFFNRGCRGYVGTETKVPITLASRFASIFFHYFYRQVVPEPISAGEALAQARLFLWTNYRNIGGLFYSFVNNYELFMADDEELKAMRG